MRIQTNPTSLAARRNVSEHSESWGRSSEKLASGSRINRAADDAAGLAISTKMGALLRSQGQGLRNVSDGISMVQVAEGALNESSAILIRLRELAMRSASDTVGATQRLLIDREAKELLEEVGRISATTRYNGKALFHSEGLPLEFQVGLHDDPDLDRVAFDRASLGVSAERLSVDGLELRTKTGAMDALLQLDQAISRVSRRRADLGALQNRLEITANNGMIARENLAGSKSRISDSDLALETAEATKEKIQTMSGVAVLSQVDGLPRLALKLLG